MITRIIEPSEEPNKGRSSFVRIVAEGLTTGELWLAEPSLNPPPYGLGEPTEGKSGFVRIVAEGLTTGELWLAEPGLKPPPYGLEEPIEGNSSFVRIVAEGLTTGELWLAEPGLNPPPYGLAEPNEGKPGFVRIVAEGLTTGELWLAEPGLNPSPYGLAEPEGVVEKQEKGVRATKPVAPVLARVIEAEGVCPMGYKFQIEDVWTLNGEEHGASGLCPVAKKALLEARERLCRDEKSILEKVLCQNGRHMVAFELEREALGNK